MAINKSKVLATAQKYIQRGNIKKAIREYQKIISADPNDVRTLLKVGDLFAKKGQYGEAIETYLKVATHYSDKGFYLKAVAVYKQVLNLEPTRSEVHLKLAQMYHQLGLLSDSMEQYQQIANRLLESGDTAQYETVLHKIIELDSDNIGHRIKLAEFYSKEGRTDQAVGEFAFAAKALRDSGRVNDFIKVAERLVYHKPEATNYLKELTKVYLDRHEWRRALAKLQMCFKVEPQDTETLYLLSQTFKNLGQNDKAMSVLQELADLHENLGDSYRAVQIRDELQALAPAPPHVDDDEPTLEIESFEQIRSFERVDYDQPERRRYDEGESYDVQAYDEGESYEVEHYQEVEPYQEVAPHEVEPYQEVEPYEGEPYQEVEPYEHWQDEDEGIEEIEPIDVPTALPIAPLPSDDVDREEEIARLLTETDVYIKYGLIDKAFEHIENVLMLDPSNLDAMERVKDIHYQTGYLAQAVDELIRMSHIAWEDPKRALEYLYEALEIDPQNEEALKLYQLLGGEEATHEPLLMPQEDEVSQKELDLAYVDVDELDFDMDEMLPGPHFESPQAMGSEEPHTGHEYEGAPGQVGEDTVEREQQDADLISFPSFDSLDNLDFSETEEITSAEIQLSEEEDIFEEMSILEGDGDGFTDLEFVDVDEGVFDEPTVSNGIDLVQLRAQYTELEEVTAPTNEAELGLFLSDNSNGIDSFEASFANAFDDMQDTHDHSASTELQPPEAPDDDTALLEAEDNELLEDLEEIAFFLEQGLLEEAEDALSELLEEFPDNVTVMRMLDELHRRTEAVAAEEAHTSPGLFARDSGRNRDEATTEIPEDTHYELGMAYLEMGLFGDAIDEFSISINQKVRVSEAYRQIGICSNKLQKPVDAAECFGRALELASNEAEVIELHYLLGMAYEELNEPEEALHHYRKAEPYAADFPDLPTRIASLSAG